MFLSKEDIIKTLRKDKPILQKELGVTSIALFGSYAKKQQKEESDIDFLVEQNEINYINLYKTIEYIQKKFPEKKIQITRKGPHLSKKFLDSIQNDLIYV